MDIFSSKGFNCYECDMVLEDDRKNKLESFTIDDYKKMIEEEIFYTELNK